MTAPSKLGFQVEVTLLEDHRLPTGTARSEHRAVGLRCLKQVGFQAGGNPIWCGRTCFRDIVLGSKWGRSYVLVPSTCHESGSNF